jgi:hypothetical protein
MTRIAALVVRDTSYIQFAGLDLAERATRLVRRAGIRTVTVVDDHHPFIHAPLAEMLLVLPERVVMEPAALEKLLRRGVHEPEDAVLLADANEHSTDVVLLSSSAVERIRAVPRVRSAIRRLAVEAVVRVVRMPARFVVRIRDVRDVPRLERAYLHHVNGGDREGFFTRNIRAFSIPLSRRLLRWSIGANEVTIAGFALAVLSDAAFMNNTY